MPMVKILNSYGEPILVHIEEEAIQKLPKNARRKLLKHGKIGKVNYKRIFIYSFKTPRKKNPFWNITILPNYKIFLIFSR